MSARKLNVRRSLERRLFPALDARGFVRHPPSGRDNLFPFGEFLRTGARGQDRLEIQFDKNLPSRFRVNLGVMPADYRPGDAPFGTVDGLHFHLMRRGIIFRRWFGARREATEPEYDAVADEVIALLPEIDEVFLSGRCTRRFWRLPPEVYGIGPWKFPMETYVIYGILFAIVGGIVIGIVSGA